MKIYTKYGDQGFTKLGNGERVSKANDTIEFCGQIDELNAYLALVLVILSRSAKFNDSAKKITRMQSELSTVMAFFHSAEADTIFLKTAIDRLENEIDEMSAKRPELCEFNWQSTCEASAHLQIARTICRRAERALTKLSNETKITEEVFAYINRLSDWLFTAALFIDQNNHSSFLPPNV